MRKAPGLARGLSACAKHARPLGGGREQSARASAAVAEGSKTPDNASGYLAWRQHMRLPLLNRPPCWLLATGIVLSTTPALAQSAADFYRGKTVTMIVSSASGGGYDTLSRVLAAHLSRHIPGNPQVIVRNMAGAGGIVATNHLYNVAAKDGTVVGGVQNNTPFEPLLGTKAATYDPLRFNWLGTPAYEVAIASVWHKTPVERWED